MGRPVEPGRTADYRMRLFVAAGEPNSAIAERNLNRICSAVLNGTFEIKVIDVFEAFDVAISENILVAPALIIDAPQKAKVYGNLQDKYKALAALGVA